MCTGIVWRALLSSGFCVLSFGAHALVCADATGTPSNPDSAYVVHGDGTATDTRSGLMWKQCSEGQVYSQGSCVGSATPYDWRSALELARSSVFASNSDWRLPNVKELSSLLEECRYSPTINDAVFPNTPDASFWSSSPSPYQNDWTNDQAWYVTFSYGGTAQYTGGARQTAKYARLVRGGRSADGAPAANLTVRVPVVGTGYGQVSSWPAGIACYNPAPGTNYFLAPDCAERYPAGTVVTLYPTPADGSTFYGWSGACTGNGPCSVTLDMVKTVGAIFNLAPARREYVGTYGFFDTGYAAGQTLDPRAKARAFHYDNGSGTSGLLEVYLPRATASAMLEAVDVVTGTPLVKASGTCGRLAISGGICALYRLEKNAQIEIMANDSGDVDASPFFFHFYADAYVSASVTVWREWAYRRAILPWFDATARLLLDRVGSGTDARMRTIQILVGGEDSVAHASAVLALADLTASVAQAPMGVGRNAERYLDATETAVRFVIGQAERLPLTEYLMSPNYELANCVGFTQGDPTNCFYHTLNNLANMMRLVIDKLDADAARLKLNTLALTRLVLDEQLAAPRGWLSDAEVAERAAAIAVRAGQTCAGDDAWLGTCGLASDIAAVVAQYRTMRDLMEQWIARAQWSKSFFPNRLQELDESERLLACIESKYAVVLGTPEGQTEMSERYLYRRYPAAALYIGTGDGRVFLQGADGAIGDIGSVAERLVSECE